MALVVGFALWQPVLRAGNNDYRVLKCSKQERLVWSVKRPIYPHAARCYVAPPMSPEAPFRCTELGRTSAVSRT